MAGALEQIAQAEEYKQTGNEAYGEGNYKKALGAYHKVFCYVNGLQAPPERAADDAARSAVNLESQIPQDRVADVKRLKHSTKLNMAACYLKLGEHQKCVDACTQALELGLPSSKAFFRRGQAHAELRNFGGARSDLERARELAPEDAAIVAELRKLREASGRGDEREKRTYAKMFDGKAADPRAQAAEAPPEPTGPTIEEVVEDAEPAAPDAEGAAADANSAGDRRPAESQAASGDGSEVRTSRADTLDEARKLDIDVRELTYAWQQSEEDVKIYVAFDQDDELRDGVDESRVQAEFGEWSILLVIKSTVEGRTPLGLRLGDFHRRLAPERCKCTVRGSRITLKLAKQVKEHWWNLLQNVPLSAG